MQPSVYVEIHSFFYAVVYIRTSVNTLCSFPGGIKLLFLVFTFLLAASISRTVSYVAKCLFACDLATW